MRGLMPLLLLALLSIGVVACGSASPISFDSKTWNINETVRYRMVDDLQRRYLYHGAQQKPLVRLLGSPDGNSGTDYTSSRYWLYCVRWRESDCSKELVIHFRPPDYQRVDYTTTRAR